MKVNIFDKILLKNVGGPWLGLFGFVSGSLGFVDLDVKCRMSLMLIMFILLMIIYIIKLYKSNKLTKVELDYEGSSIEIKRGDIFSDEYKDENTIRVFAFNEFFDTQVDDVIIAKKSLNGQVINQEVDNIKELDKLMENDVHLKENIIGNQARSNNEGKRSKYKLGTIFRYHNNIFFTAMTHFDFQNRAILSIQDYIRFLINFWDEINTYYADRTVVITLLGSGITRLENHSYNPNELLKIILWTFKLRRIKFKMPSKVVILLDESTNDKIDYFHLEENFNGL